MDANGDEEDQAAELEKTANQVLVAGNWAKRWMMRIDGPIPYGE